MTTTEDFIRQDRLAAQYGVVETGVPVSASYHRGVQHDNMTLAELSARGGKISRVRILHERGLFDISYVHGTTPDGVDHHIRIDDIESFCIPRRQFKGQMIEWAKAQGVYAKGLGLLDDGNYSILW